MKALLIVLIVINALMGLAGLLGGTTALDRVLGAIGFLDICVLLGALHIANAVEKSRQNIVAELQTFKPAAHQS